MLKYNTAFKNDMKKYYQKKDENMEWSEIKDFLQTFPWTPRS